MPLTERNRQQNENLNKRPQNRKWLVKFSPTTHLFFASLIIFLVDFPYIDFYYRKLCVSRNTAKLSSFPSHPSLACPTCTKKMRLWPEQVVIVIVIVHAPIKFDVDLNRLLTEYSLSYFDHLIRVPSSPATLER